VPGTPDVRVTVADGPAGDVLIHVLAEVHKRVEPLTLDGTRGELDDWGYASRPIRGGTAISNHASGTAVDVNATRHPLGAVHTFTSRQVAVIHDILAAVDNVVRWGGDYTGRRDEMHFEINDNHQRVAAVAARLAEEDDMTPRELLDAKFGGDALTALEPWAKKPGTIGHFLRNLGQDTDAVRTYTDTVEASLKTVNAKLDQVLAAMKEQQ
jgi:hypothetical protein